MQFVLQLGGTSLQGIRPPLHRRQLLRLMRRRCLVLLCCCSQLPLRLLQRRQLLALLACRLQLCLQARGGLQQGVAANRRWQQ